MLGVCARRRMEEMHPLQVSSQRAQNMNICEVVVAPRTAWVSNEAPKCKEKEASRQVVGSFQLEGQEQLGFHQPKHGSKV